MNPKSNAQENQNHMYFVKEYGWKYLYACSPSDDQKHILNSVKIIFHVQLKMV